MRARQVYLDNAAATWPNPPEVVSAMAHFLNQVGANPGRSGHQASVEAARVVYRAREAVAGLLGLADPLRVVFTANATHALNLALYGMLGPADHCITTSMEHNSVMRPLRDLEANGMGLTVVPCSPEGVLDPADVERAIVPETAMIVINHASNVVGTLLPVAEVAAIARAHDDSAAGRRRPIRGSDPARHAEARRRPAGLHRPQGAPRSDRHRRPA